MPPRLTRSTSVIPEYYYFYPLPSNQIVLNPNLVQNPQWK
ncbi:RagB/SusD family nutrient uptake outer membrane protein [Chitinophaga niabensis]